MTSVGDDLQYKVVVVGDSGVGKTSILNRIANGTFYEMTTSTVGAAFLNYTAEHKGSQLSIKLWDTAGQEKFQSLLPLYLRNASIALFVVDCSNSDTIEESGKYLELLHSTLPPDAVVFFVVNKTDLMEENDITVIEKLRKWGEDNSMVSFDVSAKEGTGIELLKDKIALECVRVMEKRKQLQASSLKTSKSSSECC